MQKKELIAKVAEKLGTSQKQVTEVVDATLSVIKSVMQTEDEVILPHFGSFKKKVRPARHARNPKNGDAIEVAAKNIVAFKPSKTFTDAIQ